MLPAHLLPTHLQVTIGGLEHALTPLAAANPLIHVFDRPTLYKDALWLPYRRAHADVADAVHLAVKAAGAARKPASLTAVFAHADVVGASLNSHYQVGEGVLHAVEHGLYAGTQCSCDALWLTMSSNVDTCTRRALHHMLWTLPRHTPPTTAPLSRGL